MAKTTKTAPRPKRSKAEIDEEFAEIREEAATARETMEPKAEELRKQKETEVRQAAQGLSVDAVVGEISNLGLEVSKSLAALSDQLVQEVNRLATVREAVTLEQKELERLHKIDVAATALDQLVQDYSRQKDQLEAEIAAQRTAWAEEQKQSEQEHKEQEETLKKQRQREAEEYEYRKALERKKAQDKYEEEIKLLARANKEKQEALEKSWREREDRFEGQRRRAPTSSQRSGRVSVPAPAGIRACGGRGRARHGTEVRTANTASQQGQRRRETLGGAPHQGS